MVTQTQSRPIAVADRSTGRPVGPLLVFINLLIIALAPAGVVLEIPTPIVVGVAALVGLISLAIRPDLATLMVVGIVYSNAAAVAVRVHDVPFALAAGSTSLLTVPLGYYLLIRRERLIIPPAVPWILGYLMVQLLSTLLARDSASAAEAVGIFVGEGLFLYLLIVNTVRTERMLLMLVWLLIGVGVVLSGLSLHQQLTENWSSTYWGFAQGGADLATSRTGGPFEEANRYAQILVMLLPLVLAVVWGHYSRFSSRTAIAGGALIAVAIALTDSRGAAVGFALLVVVMLLLRYINVRHLILAAAALLALFIAVPQYGSRLETLQTVPGVAEEGVEADGSVRSRITEMVAAVLVFVDHPLVGVGPNQFPAYYQEYAAEFGLRVKARERQAHNLYVDVAADSGLIGFTFFFGAIGVTLRQLARTRSALLHHRPKLAHLAGGFFLAIVAYLTTGLFLHIAYERYLWLMLGLGAVVSVIGMRQIGGDALAREEKAAAL